jgi:mRNA-degrading endonuclease YafQ of YafQ-DinJ toxin-antitoxin module
MRLKPTKIIWGDEFTRAYRKKGDIEKKAMRRALRLMGDDIYYPSLKVHKLEGQGDIRGAHATDNQVMSLTIDDSVVSLRTCCNHKDVYRNP